MTENHAWKNQQLVENFLSGIRAALPLAKEQLEVLLHVVTSKHPTIDRFLDLGCGDGILSRLLLQQYPSAKGVLLDFSEPMLEAARKNFTSEQATIYQFDMYQPLELVHAPFDVVVSGYAIHHLTDERKKSLYAEIYDLLSPGGVFVNVEHVASPSAWVENLWNQAFIDNLYEMEQRNGGAATRAEIEDRILNAPPDDDIVTPVEVQCDWLREIGFEHVDCYMKIYALAVFGGIKPE